MFTPANCTNCNLDKDGFVGKIINDSLTKSAHTFTVPSLDDFIDDHGDITVDLGVANVNKLKFHPTYFETDIEVDYVWMGKDTSGDNTLLLAGNNGYLAGFITTNRDNYEILPVTDEYSVIRKIDQERYPDARCDLTDTSSVTVVALPQDQIDLCEEKNICTSTVDILALIPPDVVEWYG